MITIVAVTGSLYAATGAEWDAIYSGYASGPGQKGFIDGGAILISTGWGIPIAFSQTMLAVMVVLFAGTTMDAGLRLQRYIIQEWGSIYNIAPFKNNIVATLVAIAACLMLAFGVSAGNYPGDGGALIWPVFGGTNQILAAMTLLLIAVYLMRLGRPTKAILMPMIFIFVMAFWASCWYIVSHYQNGQWALVVIEVLVMITSIMVMLEALGVISKIRSGEIAVESSEAANAGE